MKIMQLSKRKSETGGAPRQAHLMGEPHMLAYINEAERQMLKRAGGAEAPGPEGIPVYGFWSDVWSEITSGGAAQTETFNGGSSNNSSPAQGPYSTTSSGGRNLDADNFAGSNYAPTANAGTAKAFQHTTDDDDKRVIVDGSTTNFNSPTSVTNADLQSGNYDVYRTAGGGQIVVAKGTNIDDVPQVGFDDNNIVGVGEVDFTSGGGGDGAVGGGTVITGGDGDGGGGTPAAPPVNQALLDALARRDAALSTQMGNIGTAFGFSTDDYYDQLGTDYREGGLSEAFTTAYDDATRGIYDTFKSAGMLTQQGVDDSMGILASAEGGEEGRIDGIVNQYTTANRNFVNDGRTGMEGTLQGFVTDTQDIPTIDAETAQILGYDVAGNSQPFKTPKEQEVVDFFTDFVKRSYDPSYNVDPTAVASGGPSRVSGSVDQLGAGTQPSTIAGILDPIAGGSVKVIG